MNISDVNFASRLRTIIETMVRKVVNEEAPIPRYGNVIRLNRFTGTCDVLLQGDTEPVKCSMTRVQQPTYSQEGLPGYAGDVVRVNGRPGSYYVEAVLSVSNFSAGNNFYNPTIWTGEFFHVPTIMYDSYSSGLPALGSTWHCGRWNNDTSFVTDAQGMIDIEIQWSFFTAQTKKYQLVIRPNSTNGQWVKVAPVLDSGPLQDNEFGLEILVDTAGFELRIRRIAQGGGFAPAGWDVRLQIWLDNAYKVQSSVLGEQVTTEPTKFFACMQDPKWDKGPFAGPAVAMPRILQTTLTGGGTISFDGNNFGWSSPFIALGVGKGWHSKFGYFEIAQPAAGTVVNCYGNSGNLGVFAAATGIPMTGNQSLYYEPTYGDGAASVPGNFRLVDPTNLDFTTPSHWILIAQRTTQGGDVIFKLGTGEHIEAWRIYQGKAKWSRNDYSMGVVPDVSEGGTNWFLTANTGSATAETILNTWVSDLGTTGIGTRSFQVYSSRLYRLAGMMFTASSAAPNVSEIRAYEMLGGTPNIATDTVLGHVRIPTVVAGISCGSAMYIPYKPATSHVATIYFTKRTNSGAGLTLVNGGAAGVMRSDWSLEDAGKRLA